jgi:hypothetical protein
VGGIKISIWLGYIENDEGSSAQPDENNIRKLIEDVNRTDEKIGELEQKLDKELTRIGHDFEGLEFRKIYSGEVKAVIEEVATILLELDEKMKVLEEEIEGFTLGKKSSNGREDESAGSKVHMLRIETITDLQTYSNHNIIEHRVPGGFNYSGKQGSTIIQDLGRKPGSLSFKGVLTSKKNDSCELQKKVEALQWYFNCQHPIYFSSKLVNHIEMPKVIIEDLNFEENISSPFIVKFYCKLREYTQLSVMNPEIDLESKLRAVSKIWSEYQALKVAIRYRSKFISPSGNITKSEIANKVANAVILKNVTIRDKIEV